MQCACSVVLSLTFYTLQKRDRAILRILQGTDTPSSDAPFESRYFFTKGAFNVSFLGQVRWGRGDIWKFLQRGKYTHNTESYTRPLFCFFEGFTYSHFNLVEGARNRGLLQFLNFGKITFISMNFHLIVSFCETEKSKNTIKIHFTTLYNFDIPFLLDSHFF